MATATTDSRPKDPVTNRKGLVTPRGQTAHAEAQYLMGDVFEGTTVDSASDGRWTVTTGSGGTITQTGGAMTLNSSTNTSGNAQLLSNQVIKYLPGSDVVLQATLRFGTVGIANNDRNFGLRVDGNDYLSFALADTDWIARAYTGGAAFDTDVPINVASADSLAYMELEMRVNKSRAHFIVNGEQVAEFACQGGTSVLQDSSLVQVWAQSQNSGSSVANTIIITDLKVFRYFHASRGPARALFLETTSDQLVFRGPGELVGIHVFDGVGAQTITLYDNTAASGTKLFEHQGSTLAVGWYPINVEIQTGLYVDFTGGSADPILILYRT